MPLPFFVNIDRGFMRDLETQGFVVKRTERYKRLMTAIMTNNVAAALNLVRSVTDKELGDITYEIDVIRMGAYEKLAAGKTETKTK